MVDRINYQEGQRQQRALEIHRARRYRANYFPVAHLVGWRKLALKARGARRNVLPEELGGEEKGRAAVERSEPGRPVKTDERLPGIALLDPQETAWHWRAVRAENQDGFPLVCEGFAKLIDRLHSPHSPGVGVVRIARGNAQGVDIGIIRLGWQNFVCDQQGVVQRYVGPWEALVTAL